MTAPASLLTAWCLYLRCPVISHSSMFQLDVSSCALAEPKPPSVATWVVSEHLLLVCAIIGEHRNPRMEN